MYPLNGQKALTTTGERNRHAFGAFIEGNGAAAAIDTLPAAFGITGANGLKFVANPNGTASTSVSRMQGSGHGGGNVIIADVDNYTYEATLMLDWTGANADGDCDWLRITNQTTAIVRFRQTGTAASPQTTVTIGGADHVLSSPVPIGDDFKIRVGYERNSRIRVWIDDTLVLDESHSVNTAVRGRTLGLYVTGGDLVDEAAVQMWAIKESWRNSIVTPAQETDLYVNPPCHTGPPGDDSGRKQTLWTRFPVETIGDGGDDTDLEVVFQLSTDAGFSSPTSVSVDVAAADEWCAFATFAIDPLTEYWHRAIYRLKTGSVELGRSEEQSFTTLSAPGGTKSTQLRFHFGGDSSEANVRQPLLWSEISLARSPNFFGHLGDIVYADSSLSAGITDNYGDSYQMNLLDLSWARIGAQTSLAMIWDGHEVQSDWHNDSPPAVFAGAQDYYWHYVSKRNGIQRADIQPTFSETDTHGYTFDTAACRVIVMDARRYRTAPSGSGDAARLGSAQLAWVKSLLASNDKPFVFLISPNPMSARWTSGGYGRGWYPFYTDERDDILDSFSNNNSINAKLLIISADIHWLDWGRPEATGTNNVRDPNIYEFLSAPLNQTLSAEAMTWDSGVRFFQHADATGVNDVGRAFTEVDVDEENSVATIRAIDGNDGTVLHTMEVAVATRTTAEILTDIAGLTNLLVLASTDGMTEDHSGSNHDPTGSTDVGTGEAMPSGRPSVGANGSSSQINLGTPDGLNLIPQTDAFTLAALVRADDSAVAMTIIAKGGSTTANRNYELAGNHANNINRVFALSGGAGSNTTNGSYPREQWKRIIMVSPAATSGMLVYIDGVEQGWQTGTGAIGTGTNSLSVRVFARHSTNTEGGGLTQFFDGSAGLVLVGGTALDASGVASLDALMEEYQTQEEPAEPATSPTTLTWTTAESGGGTGEAWSNPANALTDDTSFTNSDIGPAFALADHTEPLRLSVLESAMTFDITLGTFTFTNAVRALKTNFSGTTDISMTRAVLLDLTDTENPVDVTASFHSGDPLTTSARSDDIVATEADLTGGYSVADVQALLEANTLGVEFQWTNSEAGTAGTVRVEYAGQATLAFEAAGGGGSAEHKASRPASRQASYPASWRFNQ